MNATTTWFSGINFPHIIENVNDGIIFMDEQMIVRYVNNAVVKMFGYQPDELENKHVFDLPDYNKYAEFLKDKVERYKNAVPENYEMEVSAKNGSKMWLSVNSSPVKNENNEFIGSLSILSNISERKKEENKVRLFRKLVNQSNDILFLICPASGYIFDANATACQTLGYSREQIRKIKITDVSLTKKNINLWQRHVSELRVHEKMLMESEYRKKDKKIFPVEVSTRLVKVDGVEYIVAVARDITKRKETDKILIESRAKFSELFENSPVSLAEEDFSEVKKYIEHLQSKGVKNIEKYFEQVPESVKKCARLAKITEVNLTTVKMFESEKKEDFIGSLLPRLNGKYSLRNFSKEIICFLNNNKCNCENYDFRILPSGETLHTVCRVSIAPGYENTWSKVYVSIADITKLKETKTKLQEKNNELNTFIYKASHDLRSPLASVMGLSILAKTNIKDKEALKYIGMIGDSTRRMDVILTNLLSISTLMHGIPQMNPVMMKPIIKEIIQNIKYSSHVKNVHFKIISNQKKEILSDNKILYHIFQNLIDNAAKYKNPKKEKHSIQISVSDTKQKWIKISVKDNGCGMDEKTKNKIFDMFYRGNEQSKGTGLGLYMVKLSVEKLGGKIEVKSEAGKGSVFTIFLPK